MAESDDIPILTSEVFEDLVLKSEKPVVIFCYLKDAGLCNIKYEEFKHASKKHHEKMKFLRLDIGRSKDLAFEHRVMSVPAVLCFNQGQNFDRWTNIGYQDSIEAFVEKSMGSKFDRLPEGLHHVTEDNFKDTVQKSVAVAMLNFWKPDHAPSWLLVPELLEMNEKFKHRLKICVTNFDSSRDLATQFRVFNVPTTIFFKRGEAVERLVGIQSRYAVEKVIKSLLEEN